LSYYALARNSTAPVCLSVRLSPVKFVKPFATWQHLAAQRAGAYRIDSDTLVKCMVRIALGSRGHDVSRAAVISRDVVKWTDDEMNVRPSQRRLS